MLFTILIITYSPPPFSITPSPISTSNKSLGYENVVQSLPASMGFLEDPDNSIAKPRMKAESPSLPSKVKTVERSSTEGDGFKNSV